VFLERLSCSFYQVANTIFSAVRAYVDDSPRTRTAVIVLSQLNLLPGCDLILLWNSGKLGYSGSYDHFVKYSQEESQDDTDGGGGWGSLLSHYVGEGGDETLLDDGDMPPNDVVSTSLITHLPPQTKVVTKAVEDECAANTLRSAGNKKTRVGASNATTTDGGGNSNSDDLVKKEAVTQGVIAWRVFSSWSKSAHRPTLATAVAGYVLSVVVLAFNDLWIAEWAISANPKAQFAAVYACLSCSHLIALVVASFILVFASTNAGATLHDGCFRTVVGAPMSWFEATPSGRIVSRSVCCVNKEVIGSFSAVVINCVIGCV
jgi:hypothetical protein